MRCKHCNKEVEQISASVCVKHQSLEFSKRGKVRNLGMKTWFKNLHELEAYLEHNK